VRYPEETSSGGGKRIECRKALRRLLRDARGREEQDRPGLRSRSRRIARGDRERGARYQQACLAGETHVPNTPGDRLEGALERAIDHSVTCVLQGTDPSVGPLEGRVMLRR